MVYRNIYRYIVFAGLWLSLSAQWAEAVTSLQQVNTTSPQLLQNKTLDSTDTLNNTAINNPVISGTITGTYSFGGNAILLSPTFQNPIINGTITGTYTLGGTVTITAPAISNPTMSGGGILGGTYTGTYTLAGSPTLTAPAITTPTISTPVFSGGGTLAGTYTGTYSLNGTPTITAPTLNGVISGSSILKPANGGTGIATVPTNGQLLIGNGVTYTAGLPTMLGNGLTATTGAGTLSLANTGALDGVRGLSVKPSNPVQGTFNNIGNSYAAQAGVTFYNLFDGTAADGFIVSAPTTFTGVNLVIASTTGNPTTVVYETCQGSTWTSVSPGTVATWTAIGFTQVVGIPTGGWTTGACNTANVPAGSFNLRIRQTVGTKTITGRASLAQFLDAAADEVIASDTSGTKVRTTALTYTSSIQCTGTINCLDTGSVGTSTYYYLWTIYNGSQWGGLFSLSATAPTMPSGYTFKLLTGGYQTDANSLLRPWVQAGARIMYSKPIAEFTNGWASITATTVTVPPIAQTWIGMPANANGTTTVQMNDVPFVLSSVTIRTQCSVYLSGAGVSGSPCLLRFTIPQVIYGDTGAAAIDLFTNGYLMPGNLN